ncbi:MAG: hypothetical protein EHM18_18905, partial [Acidobacteria bacterium]
MKTLTGVDSRLTIPRSGDSISIDNKTSSSGFREEEEKMPSYHILVMSDGTGETAYRMLKAAMAQFQEDV